MCFYYRMSCEDDKFYLLLATFITGFLWIVSEIIGGSKCKPNGVFEFIIGGFCNVSCKPIITRDEENHAS